jgi:hypothetical protein
MPFLGTASSGDQLTRGASAGICRAWADTSGLQHTIRGYPIRILGMSGLVVTVQQDTGLLATIRVQVALTDFAATTTDAAWVTLATTAVTTLGTAEVIMLAPVVGHHARVRIDVTTGNSTGSYTIGAIHT